MPSTWSYLFHTLNFRHMRIWAFSSNSVLFRIKITIYKLNSLTGFRSPAVPSPPRGCLDWLGISAGWATGLLLALHGYTLRAPLASEPTPYCISPDSPKAYHFPPMLSTSAACMAPESGSSQYHLPSFWSQPVAIAPESVR